MFSVYAYTDYRAFLRDLVFAKKETKSLSLRAVARKLQVSPSALSNVLNGTRHFSPTALAAIAERLQLPTSEQEHLVALSVIDGNPPTRLAASVRDRAKAVHKSFLSERDLAGLSPVEVMIFLEAIRLPALGQDLSRIAERMGVPLSQIERMCGLLLVSGVLTRDASGSLVKSKNYLQLAGDSAGPVLRELNKEMLRLAIDCIRPETVDQRCLGTETFAFSPEYLPEAQRIIDRCLNDLAALSEKEGKAKTVYHAGIQFFEVLRPERRRK